MNEPQGNFYELDFGARSHLGRRRKNNEDYVTFFVPDDPEVRSSQGSLFIVADGVGGASKGEYASQFAAEKVVYEYYNQRDLPPAQRLVQCIQLASREIYNFTQNSSIITRMASTLVAALVIRNQLYVANVGDSRAYLIRGGKIRQVSRDHSLVGELIDQGLMNEQQASTSKTKNKLTRSVGGDAEVEVDLFGPIPLHLGDRLLLCTDGLTRYAMQEDLLRMAGQEEPAQVVKKLQEFALQHGGADNVSSILLETVVKSKTTLKAPIQHVGRVTTPEWQRVSTDYPHLDQMSKGRTPSPYLPMVIAVLSILALIALSSGLWFGVKHYVLFNTPVVTNEFTSTPFINLEVTQTSQALKSNINNDNNTALQTLNVLDDSCILLVNPGQSLIAIFTKYYGEKSYIPDMEYTEYKFEDCALDEKKEIYACRNKLQFQGPSLSDESPTEPIAGYWLVISPYIQYTKLLTQEGCYKFKDQEQIPIKN